MPTGKCELRCLYMVLNTLWLFGKSRIGRRCPELTSPGQSLLWIATGSVIHVLSM